VTTKPGRLDPAAATTRLPIGMQVFLQCAMTIVAIVTLASMLWSATDAYGWAILWAVLGIGGALRMLYVALGASSGQIDRLASAVHALARGDLAADMSFPPSGAVAQIGRDIDSMAANMSITVANIRNNALVIAQTGDKLAHANNELSQRTSQQAAALEQTSASIQQITATVHQNAESATQVDSLATALRATAGTGEEAMRVAVEAIHGIQTTSTRMSEIVAVIDGIAFQTNMLALNAAVEAARAGEQGRSFAVVAAEVGTLAQRSKQAAREIKTLIESSSEQIGEGVTRVNAVAETLTSILSGVQQVAERVSEISGATTEQSKGLGQVALAIGELDSITQNNAQIVDECAQVATRLSERSARISKLVQRFRLRQGSAEEAMALVHRVLDHAARHGTQAAIDAVNDPKMKFFDRDMYVFVGDANAVFLACAGRPERLGTSMLKAPGIDGRKIHALTVACADQGGGWIEYEIQNPATGAMEPKMSYIKRLGRDLNVGCGVYRTESMSMEN
jgi:methyl-accepting chemotaxis protein